jgi:hypothetical protein
MLDKRIVRLNTVDKASPRIGKYVFLHCIWGEVVLQVVKMVLYGVQVVKMVLCGVQVVKMVLCGVQVVKMVLYGVQVVKMVLYGASVA